MCLPLIRLSLHTHLQFTDKENEETEQNKIVRMEKELARLKRKNKKAAEGMFKSFLCCYQTLGNL